MKIVLMTILIFTISCGKNQGQNELSSRNDLKIFESKSYASFDHPSESSILRRKLLNYILEQKIAKRDSYNFTSDELNEELKTAIENKKLNILDQEDYNNRLNFQEKIVILSDTNTEIFFVPKGVPFKEAFGYLKLTQPLTNELIIINEPITTQKNHVTYIVPYTVNDLIENDKFFTKLEKRFDIQDESFALKVDNAQKLQIFSQSQFFIQNFQVARVAGTPKKCLRDLMEAGLCYNCSYEREVLLSDFSPFVRLSTSHLDIVHNGSEQRRDKKDSSDKIQLFEVEFSDENEIEVALRNQKIEPIIIESNIRNVEGLCEHFDRAKHQSRLNRQIKVRTEGTVIIWGRGNKLRSLI